MSPSLRLHTSYFISRRLRQLLVVVGVIALLLPVVASLGSSLASSGETEQDSPQRNSSNSHWGKLQHAVGLLGSLIFQVGHADVDVDADTVDTDEHQKKKEGLSLLGAGLSRTGTKSIEAALGQLGYRVYDLRAVMEHNHQERLYQATKLWCEQDDLSLLKELVQEIEALGYSATLDTPLNFLTPAIVALRPQAKVLWGFRNSPEEWVESFQFIIDLAVPLEYARPTKWVYPPTSAWIEPIQELIIPKLFPSVPGRSAVPSEVHLRRILPWYEVLDKEAQAEANEQNRARHIFVYQNFPSVLKEALVNSSEEKEEEKEELLKARYLEFSVQKHGWPELLDFLEPGEYLVDDLRRQDFPHVNERATLKMIGGVLQILSIGLPVWLGLIMLVSYMVTKRLFRFCRNMIGMGGTKSKTE